MSTTVKTILDAAIASSLANDQGESELTENTSELVGVLSRFVRSIFTLAGMPSEENGWGRGGFFIRTASVVLATPSSTPVAFPAGGTPEFVYLISILDAGGNRVALVSDAEVDQEMAEFPPAVIIADNKIRSAARTGDPAASAQLTLRGTYLPAELTLTTHIIGATSPTDASTTAWPGYVGDQYLIDAMRLYLAIKDGARDTEEIQSIKEDLAAGADALGRVLRVNKASLVQVVTE